MAEESYASNPANVRPQLFLFLRRELILFAVVSVVVGLIFLPLGMFVWRWLWLGLMLIPATVWLVYYGQCRLLRLGACCPAKVVSLDPPRLAIFSDMTMREDAAHPAIIVKEFSPKWISSPLVKPGDRLVVAAFYMPGDERLPEERWKTLSVIEPIRAVTRNEHDLRRTFESIDADEWKQLEAGLPRVQPPYEEKVYFLEPGRKDGGKGVTEGRVFVTPSDDPEMKKVQAFSRKTFRFFLRELSWEQRRVIGAMELAAVKIAFSDPPEMRSQHPADFEVEYMWISEVEFDGRQISGVLLNEPDSLQSVHEGDQVSVKPNQIVDWMYSVQGEVCGGFTVQLLRRRMDKQELKSHDSAWGLEFGAPGVVRLIPDNYLPAAAQKKRTAIPEIEGMAIQGDYKVIDDLEHPMSVNCRESFEEELAGNPEVLFEDQGGLFLLHSMVMAGSLDGVEACLKHGADPNQRAANGLTPTALAKGLGWKKILARLERAGGNS